MLLTSGFLDFWTQNLAVETSYDKGMRWGKGHFEYQAPSFALIWMYNPFASNVYRSNRKKSGRWKCKRTIHSALVTGETSRTHIGNNIFIDHKYWQYQYSLFRKERQATLQLPHMQEPQKMKPIWPSPWQSKAKPTQLPRTTAQAAARYGTNGLKLKDQTRRWNKLGSAKNCMSDFVYETQCLRILLVCKIILYMAAWRCVAKQNRALHALQPSSIFFVASHQEPQLHEESCCSRAFLDYLDWPSGSALGRRSDPVTSNKYPSTCFE